MQAPAFTLVLARSELFHRQAGVVVSAEKTRAVVEHHAAALMAGDLDGVMEDYTEDSVVITNLGGVVRGLDALRAAFGAVSEFPGFEQTCEHVEGECAYVTWKMTGVAFGTDTFVVRDGKIALQTAAVHLA
jgi:hypothetical protein